MQGLTVPDTETAQSKPVSARRVRIPDAVRRACTLLADGECKTIKAAAERVNLSPAHLSRMLGREHVRVFMAREASKTIAGAAMRASRRYAELVDANSEHVSAQVCERILVSEGHLRSDATQVAVNVAVSPGYVIDVSPERVVPHEQTSQPKPLTHKDSVPNDE